MTTANPISSHAAKAVTRLIGECHMMEFCDADAERIVQDAIDASNNELVAMLKAAQEPELARQVSDLAAKQVAPTGGPS